MQIKLDVGLLYTTLNKLSGDNIVYIQQRYKKIIKYVEYRSSLKVFKDIIIFLFGSCQWDFYFWKLLLRFIKEVQYKSDAL